MIRLLTLDVVDSTNSEAARLHEAGEPMPVWIRAVLQQSGRGRQGRDWVSPRGNLHATLLISLRTSILFAAQLSFVAALAMRDTVVKLLGPTGPSVSLKWPNDVLIAGRKVSGILVETLGYDQRNLSMAVGCGLNVASTPPSARTPACSLADHGAHPALDQVMAELAQNMDFRLEQWEAGPGFPVIREHWLSAAAGLGQELTIALDRRDMTGRFETLTEDGALALRLADGTREVLHAGEVTMISPSGGGW